VHKSTDRKIPSSAQSVEGQEFLSKDLRLRDRYELQKLLVEALRKTEYHQHLAPKVENCHKKFRHKRCNNGHDWASPAKAHNSCSFRLCPHCSRQKAQKVGMKFKKFLVGRTGSRYVVLSERNSVSLDAGRKSLEAAWNSLRRSVQWKRKVRGAVVVFEVTRNVRAKTWHPHLNILFEGEYFPVEELKQLWMAATEGRGRSVYIQAANEGTVDELIKYTMKIAERKESGPDRVFELLFEEPEVLDEFLSVMYGVRLIRTYGTFRGIDVEAEEEEEEKCPDCGSTCIVDLGPAPKFEQLIFDFDKQIFRIPVNVKKPPSAWVDPVSFPVEHFALMEKTDPERIGVAVEMRHRARRYEAAVRQRMAA
jgi:hypothetical protein